MNTVHQEPSSYPTNRGLKRLTKAPILLFTYFIILCVKSIIREFNKQVQNYEMSL